MSEAIVLAGANRSTLYYAEETVWGETPVAAGMQEIPRVSDTLEHIKTTVVPRTLRSDRAREDLIRVGEDAGGGVIFEMRHTQYDTLLAALLGAPTLTPVGIVGVLDIAVVASDQSFNSTTTNFVAAGFVPGQRFRTSGFLAAGGINNQTFEVAGVTTTKLAVVPRAPALVDEGVGAPTTFHARMARNGTTKRSFYLERAFLEQPAYQQFTGMMCNQLALTMNAREILQGTLSLIGKRGDAMIPASLGSGIFTTGDNPAMDASNNLLAITKNGVALSQPVLNTNITFNNNLALRPVVSNRFPIGVRWGTLDITGTLEAYFVSQEVWQQFVDHGHAKLIYHFQDVNDKQLFITLPRVYLETGPMPVTGENTDIMATFTYRAVIDKALGYMVQIDSIE